MSRKLLHKIIGHIPYYVYGEGEDMRYRCTLCDNYLRKSVYNRLEVVSSE